MVKQSPKIVVSDEAQKGTYSNVMRVSHSPFEFTFDFGSLPIGPEDGGVINVYNRIVMSPPNAKIMLKVLEDNVKIFEKNFGEIKIPEQKEIKPGVSSLDQVYIV